MKLKTNTTVPADIAITQSADIEVPDYLPGFTSWDCATILTVTMLCYALPVTVTNQNFTEINRLIHRKGSQVEKLKIIY